MRQISMATRDELVVVLADGTHRVAESIEAVFWTSSWR